MARGVRGNTAKGNLLVFPKGVWGTIKSTKKGTKKKSMVAKVAEHLPYRLRRAVK